MDFPFGTENFQVFGHGVSGQTQCFGQPFGLETRRGGFQGFEDFIVDAFFHVYGYQYWLP
jgi:hypothetical protein